MAAALELAEPARGVRVRARGAPGRPRLHARQREDPPPLEQRVVHRTDRPGPAPPVRLRRVIAAGVPGPQLTRFIRRHFGPLGSAWLERLPELIERYRAEWELEVEGFLPGGLMSCWLAVRTKQRDAAVLKLCGPWTPARPEAVALRVWD